MPFHQIVPSPSIALLGFLQLLWSLTMPFCTVIQVNSVQKVTFVYLNFDKLGVTDRTIISICQPLFDIKNCQLIAEDFPEFPRICATLSIIFFCFDFQISAEQFYDQNKQELGKTGGNHKSTSNAMSNDGSSIKIIDQSHGD